MAHLSKRRIFAVLVLVGFLVLGWNSTQGLRAASSEYNFFNTSPTGDAGGLAVPASCDSQTVHSGGDGNPSDWWGGLSPNTPCGCGGTIQCDGSCSQPGPANLGQACGCSGTIQCSGSCSGPSDYGPCSKDNGCGTVTSGIFDCSGNCTAPAPPACATPRCGDFSVDAGEECDNGDAGNGSCPSTCSSSCTNNNCACSGPSGTLCSPDAIHGPEYWEWQCGCPSSPGAGWNYNGGNNCYNHQLSANDPGHCPPPGLICTGNSGSFCAPWNKTVEYKCDCNVSPGAGWILQPDNCYHHDTGVDCGTIDPYYPGVTADIKVKAGYGTSVHPGDSTILDTTIGGGTYPHRWIFKDPASSPLPFTNFELRNVQAGNLISHLYGTLLNGGNSGTSLDNRNSPWRSYFDYDTGPLSVTTTFRLVGWDGYAGNQDPSYFNTQPPLAYDDVTVVVTTGPTSGNPPKGTLESADCSWVTGWACDPDDYDAPVDVKFSEYSGMWFDNVFYYLGRITANISRPDIAASGVCGGRGVHGFRFPTPLKLKDGTPHNIHSRVIDIHGGGNETLTGSPKSITCAAPMTPPTVACSVDGLASTTVMDGGSVSFSWSSTNATSCNRTDAGSNTGVLSWDNATFPLPGSTFNITPLPIAGTPYTFGVTCTNPNGPATCSTTVNVAPFNNKPVAVINTPLAGPQPSPVDLQGTVTDVENDPIVGWEWRDGGDGGCTTGTLIGSSEDPRSYGGLSLGPHTICFRARDQWQWSDPVNVAINITVAGFMRVWPDSQSKLVGQTAQFTAYYHPVTNISDSVAYPDLAAILGTGAIDATASTIWSLTNGVPPIGQLTFPGGPKGEVLGLRAGPTIGVNASGPGSPDSASLSITQPSLIVCPQNPTMGGNTTYTALTAWYDPAGLKTACNIGSGTAIDVTEYTDAGNAANNTLWSEGSPLVSIVQSGAGAGDLTSGATYGSALISVNYPIGAPGAQSASTTMTVQCVPTTWSCYPPKVESNTCSNEDPWLVDTDCTLIDGIQHECRGTRSCDFNWKEVAP